MSADYDLIIFGHTPAGVQAALLAAQYQARVTLITQGIDFAPTLPCTPVPPLPSDQWQPAVALTLAALNAPAMLAAQGIEVITARGEFVRKPRLSVAVAGRLLRSRAYLIASDTVALIPDIPGLKDVSYQTIATIAPQLDTLTPAHHVVVLGDEPMGLAIAQRLARQKVQVTLIVKTTTLLPAADPEAIALLQAQLEVDGIQLLTATDVTQVRQIQDQVWIQAGHQAIAADTLLVALGSSPNLEGLNLEAAAVSWSAQGIPVNAHLQTTNPKIYACPGRDRGDVTYLEHLAIQQAHIAVWNALFLPIKTLPAGAIARLVPTVPELLSLGLSETQAKQRYGRDICILQQPFSTLAKAQWQGDTTGFCKLIVRRNGQILGAHLFGAQAGELGGAIALAMQQNLSVQTLATLVYPASTFAAIIPATAAEWQRQRQSQPQWPWNWRRDWLAEFFSWQRSRSR